MKYLKYLKYFLIAWFILTLLICLGGIIKYNIEVNSYISKKEPEVTIHPSDSINSKTEVYVVGTVHYETEKLKRDSFYNYIHKISPSLILYESDSLIVRRMTKRIDFINQLMSAFKKENKVESFVSLRYLKHHPEAQVLSYEWEERDAFHRTHNYNSFSSKMIGALLNSYRQNVLTSEQSAVMKKYSELNTEYFKIGRNAKVIYDLNNDRADSITRERQFYHYKLIPEIIRERPELEAYKDFVPLHMQYWDTRNKAMAANILFHIKRNPNKKIVVLTGKTHRYYLIDELKKYQEDLNFSVE